MTRFQEAPRPLGDFRDLHGPFDIIGDVHGCADELEALLHDLGYRVRWPKQDATGAPRIGHPDKRTIVFVGDLVDRGPRSPDVLKIAMGAVQSGIGLAVQGNHDNKLWRYLDGRNVRIAHGLQETINQLAGESRAFRTQVGAFLKGLPYYCWLDGGRLAVAHAGIKEEMLGKDSRTVQSFALYGDTTGEKDAEGYPVRRDWAANYTGTTTIIYGHTPLDEAVWVNNTMCVDTSCVFGGELTALRWPERELVSVPAKREYARRGTGKILTEGSAQEPLRP